MTTQPPPGAIRENMLVYQFIEDMRYDGMVLTLLDLSTRHFEDVKKLKKRKIEKYCMIFWIIEM